MAWLEYERIEPFGERRADWRTASVVQMLHNLAVKGDKQKPAEAFLLKFEEKKKPYKRTPEEEARDLTILIYSLAGAKE